MKVFMSWSGARSKAAAELLCDWTKCVIQASRPWISTRGIDRGALWFSEINNELKDTAVGIVCLTHENKDKPWILFEAGALAKGLSTSRVCTFLVDLEPKDLHDPLAQFNHTTPDRAGLWSLVVTLNSSLESGALDERILREVFATYWPQFDEKFKAILNDIPQETVVEARPAETVLDEILQTTRAVAHRVRTLEDRIAFAETPDQPFIVRSRISEAKASKLAQEIIDRQYSEVEAKKHLAQLGFGKLSVKMVLEYVEELLKGGYTPTLQY